MLKIIILLLLSAFNTMCDEYEGCLIIHYDNKTSMFFIEDEKEFKVHVIENTSILESIYLESPHRISSIAIQRSFFSLTIYFIQNSINGVYSIKYNNINNLYSPAEKLTSLELIQLILDSHTENIYYTVMRDFNQKDFVIAKGNLKSIQNFKVLFRTNYLSNLTLHNNRLFFCFRNASNQNYAGIQSIDIYGNNPIIAIDNDNDEHILLEMKIGGDNIVYIFYLNGLLQRCDIERDFTFKNCVIITLNYPVSWLNGIIINRYIFWSDCSVLYKLNLEDPGLYKVNLEDTFFENIYVVRYARTPIFECGTRNET